jgi:hypothetical protein
LAVRTVHRCFFQHYNQQRYHEALGNLTSADLYFGRGSQIMTQREVIKRQTLDLRRAEYNAVFSLT